LDPEIYGPALSSKSEVVRLDQLRKVSVKDKYMFNTLIVEYDEWSGNIEGYVDLNRSPAWELGLIMDGEHKKVATLELKFHSVARTQHVYKALLLWCAKAEEDRCVRIPLSGRHPCSG
jgi:hypothetical protein